MSDNVIPMTKLSFGGVEPSVSAVKRFSLLLWGPAGWGKTTLAATMPGKVALLCFDPDGASSIAEAVESGKVTVFDMSTTDKSIVSKMTRSDGLGLEALCDHFDSFIIDSTTSIEERTLLHGITKSNGATIEKPDRQAYMARNNVLLAFIRDCLLITGRHNKHICFIAHEATPTLSESGAPISYTMALGGQLPNQVSVRINEVWACHEDSRGNKELIIRKAHMRTPVKSRMFDLTGERVFPWYFNPNDWDDPDNMRIDEWYNTWKGNGFKKIQPPVSKRKPTVVKK